MRHKRTGCDYFMAFRGKVVKKDLTYFVAAWVVAQFYCHIFNYYVFRRAIYSANYAQAKLLSRYKLRAYRLSSSWLRLFKTFFITSKPKPRLCKNLACFTHSSRFCGLALYFLDQILSAFSSSVSFIFSTAVAMSSSATPFSRNSFATRALPNLALRAWTICSVKRASESQPRCLKSSKMAGISSVSSA